jgi:hypothetical protein
MNDSEKRLYDQLNAKSSDELLSIWQENDEEAWVPEALKLVEQILVERGVELSPAAETETGPVQVEAMAAGQTRSESLGLTNSDAILKIAKTAKVLSWVALIGWSLLITLFSLLQGGSLDRYPVSYVLVIFLANLAQGALYFFLLQILGEGIYLLLRIEKNTSREA